MNFHFLHNHYLPIGVTQGNLSVKSVIVPEFYPDLNNSYIGEPCYFCSAESYIDYVRSRKLVPEGTSFAIENNRIMPSNRAKELLSVYKEYNVKIIQLFCGVDNEYFSIRQGLSSEGIQLLSTMSEMNLILDLSHIPDNHIVEIAEQYEGKKIVSHCACSNLYSSSRPRSNSLTRDTIISLSEKIDVFGISFLNDIVSFNENEVVSERIFDNLLAQILVFTETVGPERVAFGPDYLDTGYFGHKFHTKLVFPSLLLSQEGLIILANKMQNILSLDEVNLITSANVEGIILDNQQELKDARHN